MLDQKHRHPKKVLPKGRRTSASSAEASTIDPFMPGHTHDTPPLTWKRERRDWLVRCMRLIAGRVKRGEAIGDAIKRVARTHDGKPFKTDPRRRLAASAKTLRRCWDRWKLDPTPASLDLKYAPGHRPVNSAFAQWFAKKCLKTLAPVNRTIALVRKEWLAGKQLPGLKRRQGRTHWPLHESTLYRLVAGEKLAEVRWYRRQADEASRRADILCRRILATATRKGATS